MERKDPMARPKYGERVKYLVVSGREKSKVKDLVVSVDDFFKYHNHQINSLYYIKRQLNNAMGRIFSTFDVKISVNYNFLLFYNITLLKLTRTGLKICLKVFKSQICLGIFIKNL